MTQGKPPAPPPPPHVRGTQQDNETEIEVQVSKLLGCPARPVLRPFSETMPSPSFGTFCPMSGKIFQLGSWQSHRAAKKV